MVNKLLESTSKYIISIKENFNWGYQGYNDAQNVCADICGRIYFPSTLEENIAVKNVLNEELGPTSGSPDGYFYDDVWIRIVYNTTIGDWTDPDDEKTLTFQNFFYQRDKKPRYKEALHVRMDSLGDWMSRSGTRHLFSKYVLCELT